MFCADRIMSVLIFEAKSDRKQWRFMLQRAKYTFIFAGVNMPNQMHSNIILRVGIGVVYK